MKKSMKTSLIIIALALIAGLAGFVWLGSRSLSHGPDELVADSVSDTSRGPAFEVHVVVPRSARPLAGIVPDWVVKKLDGTPSELQFNHNNPGARIGRVSKDHLELSADGWELLIQIDGEGRAAPETHLVFSLALGGRQVRLNCRPADRAIGYLSATTRPESEELAGRFLVELASCKNADSGKTTNWPATPLTVRGSFVGQPRRPSPDPSAEKNDEL